MSSFKGSIKINQGIAQQQQQMSQLRNSPNIEGHQMREAQSTDRILAKSNSGVNFYQR